MFGKVQGLHGALISYEGSTIDEITSDFHGAVDDYLESCKQRGVGSAKSYSGKLVLRMSSELHGQVAAAAFAIGTTLNDFINQAVTNEVAHVVR